MNEHLNTASAATASIMANNGVGERGIAPHLKYTLECRDAQGNLKWVEDFTNLVTTAGKNDLLDQYFAGASYSAGWYLGLINSSGYTAVAVTDTSASHTGWTEVTDYTAATRPALTWTTAAAGSKSTSAAASFTANANVTIKGAFVINEATKGGTTGVLYSCGAFAADRSLVSTDVLNVNVTMTA